MSSPSVAAALAQQHRGPHARPTVLLAGASGLTIKAAGSQAAFRAVESGAMQTLGKAR